MLFVFGATDRQFVSNGDHTLKATKAVITKEDNADYLIELEAPLSEQKWLKEGQIVAADTPWGRQGFRLTNPTIRNHKVIVKGRHIYFDTERYVIAACSEKNLNANEIINRLNEATDQESPFAVSSDLVNIVNSLSVEKKSLREAVDAVIEGWGGHLERDNYIIRLRERIGQDRDVVIRYAKNLESLSVEENWKEVATKIMPVGKDDTLLPELYVEGEIQYEIPYTKVVKIDQNLDEKDYENEEAYKAALVEDLRAQAAVYLQSHALPQCCYTLKAHLQDVADVGDVIRVVHPGIPVDLLTNVTAVKWNCLTKRYDSVTFGTAAKKLSGLHTSIKAVENKVDVKYAAARQELSEKLAEATGKIWSAMSDSHVIYDGDKILVVDLLPKEKAKNCILINAGGIGFSTTGINGEFSTAWTMDGTMNMEVLNVLNLSADMIKTGTLDASLVTISNLVKAINKASGEEKIAGSKVEINGETVESVVQRIDRNYQEIVGEERFEFVASAEAPTEPEINDVWLCTDSKDQAFYFWDGEIWRKISDFAETIKEIRAEQSQILQEAEGVTLQHLANYVQSSDLVQLQEAITTELSVLEGLVEMRFETATETTATFGSALELLQNTIYTNIQFNEDGIKIGKSDSPFFSRFGNDKLSFLQDGQEIAYISNNKLYIREAEIEGSLWLGNESIRARWFLDDKNNVVLQ